MHTQLFNYATIHTLTYTTDTLYTQYIGTTMHTLHTPGENVATHNLHCANDFINELMSKTQLCGFNKHC